MKTITLPYWGHIIGLVSRQPASQNTAASTTKEKEKASADRSLFITRPPATGNGAADNHQGYKKENSRAVLYRLDNVGEQVSLSTAPLPCAMTAMTEAADERIILLGADGHLYQTDWQAENITQISNTSLLTVLPATADAQPTNSLQAVGLQLLKQAIAVLYPKHMVICPLDEQQSASVTPIVQPYPDTSASVDARQFATAMAASSDGEWLVIGDDAGMVSSYQWHSDAQQLILSSSKPLHQGRVNALCFEPVSQYFFSAGTDKQLYRTHVQGELHAIDRAKASGHSQMITALCVSDTRLFTAADDCSIKSWAFDKGQPSTCKDNLNKTTLLTYSRYAENPALLAVGTDQSLRFVPIDEAKSSKPLDVTHIIEDGYERIQQLLTDSSHNNEAAFNEAMSLLARQADAQTLEVVSRLLKEDKKLMTSRALQLTTWLADTHLDARLPILEAQLTSSRASSIRLAAFNALAKAEQQASTTGGDQQGLPAYLERALESRYEDVVAAALQGYLKVALGNVDYQPRVLTVLQEALSHQLLPIRRQALASLERLLPDNSPKADLMALSSRYDDTMQAGLIRLYQRGLLSHPEVARQLMLLQSHRQADIRQTAFYVTLLSQPKLIEALKAQAEALGDAQLLRTLTDFDDFRLLRGTVFDHADSQDKSTTDHNDIVNTVIGAQFQDTANQKASNTGKDGDEQALHLALDTQGFVSQAEHTADNASSSSRKANTKKTTGSQKAVPITLSNSSLEPLLQNLSNHYEDISFRAAYALACLQDTRAFGTLFRFMHHDNNAMIRAGVATALGHLRMAGGKTILPTLLDDSDASVRQVAMSALGKLSDDTLSWVALGFASKHQDVHERALAVLLTQVLDDKADSRTIDATSLSAILTQALNNPFTSIRLEAVKVILNRETSRQNTPITSVIALLQDSLFEDVHQVALEEWQRTLLQSTAKAKAKTTEQQQTYQAALDLLFADNFATIRKQAFDTALKHSKRFGFHPLMLSAFTSPFDDIKGVAMDTLRNEPDPSQLREVLPALIHLFADDSIALRQQALDVALALVTQDGSTLAHQEGLITTALASPYPDIQLTVAKLLASQTDNHPQQLAFEAKAYAVFKKYLETDMPVYTQKEAFNEAYKQWHKQIDESLMGVALLSTPQKYQAFDWYAKYLHHPDADFTALAPNLMYIVTGANADTLAMWQKDERPIVRQSASLALAVWGDARGEYFFRPAANKSGKTKSSQNTDSLRHLVEPMGPIEWLQARAGLGITHAKALRELFNTDDYAPAARLLLIFNTLSAEDTPPEILIEALSFADNDTANVYAHVLARANQPIDATWAYLSEYVGQKLSHLLSTHAGVLKRLEHSGETEQRSKAAVLRTVDVAHLQQLAFFTQHEQPLMRTQAIRALCHLSELLTQSRYEDTSTVFTALQIWLQQSEGLSAYHQSQSTTLQKWQRGLSSLLHRQKPASSTKSNQHLPAEQRAPYQTLAFGAWLGVIRDNDNDYAYNNSDSSSRAQAIRGLIWLAAQSSATSNDEQAPDTDWADSVSRVLLPLLHHSHIETRELAWDSLLQLSMPTDRLANYAISTPYRDMIDRGLQWLIDSCTDTRDSDDISAQSNQQLVLLLGTTHHTLAAAVYERLYKRVGHLPASIAALKTDSIPLLRQVIGEWQQVPVRIDAPFAIDMNAPLTPEQTLRAHKLDFLSQARYCHDWQARYQAFAQLIDFYEILLTDPALMPSLFALLMEGANRREQNQAFGLITTVLQSYQRLMHTTDAPWVHFDKANLASSTDIAYAKMFALLDNAASKLPSDNIYEQIASLRNAELGAQLRARLQQRLMYPERALPQERQQLFDALITISGYDQPIKDYLGEQTDQSWQARQHPRDLDALLSLFNLLMRYGDYQHAAMLVNALAWIPAPVNTALATDLVADKTLAARVDTALLLAYEQLPAKYLPNLIKAVAYRAKKRLEHASDQHTGSVTDNEVATLTDILKKALMNKEAPVSFLAAEGLAHCGSSEGLSILMATADYHDNGDVRRRSVLAIGEMMRRAPTDSTAAQNTQALYKAYDKLIKLAEDDEHYLKDVAAEALGHIAQGGAFEYSAQIFALLKANITDPELLPYNAAITHWLNGLRWLDTTAAWEQIRNHIERQRQAQLLFEPQYHAISLLAHHDSAENKALLLDILKRYSRHDTALKTAYTAAQNLWGCDEDQVYDYDWAAIQNSNASFIASTAQTSLKRITDHSTLETLAPFITKHGQQLPVSTLTELQNALLTKPDMRAAQLYSLLDHTDAQTQQLGLRYLTQYPSQYLDDTVQQKLTEQLAAAQQAWQSLLSTVSAQPTLMQQQHWLMPVTHVTTTMTQIVWLICRHTTASNTVLPWLSAQLTQAGRSQIVTLAASVNGWWQQALLALLARPSTDDQQLTALVPTLTEAAQSTQLTPDNHALLTALLTRLTGNNRHGQSAIYHASTDTPAITQQQLVHWIKAKDAAALYHCAQDNEADLSIRVRAVEALGWLHDPQIGTWLESLMTDKQGDADLQKLAYKVLRRWQRLMNRAQQKRPTAPHAVITNNSNASFSHSAIVTQQSSQGEG
jgi:hypothetical protein